MVGTILVLINHVDVLINGQLAVDFPLRYGHLVPYSVATAAVAAIVRTANRLNGIQTFLCSKLAVDSKRRSD